MSYEFLRKLKKEGKLRIDEPSEEIKKSYLEKSKSNMESCEILLERDKLEEVVSLAYYSMYNLVLALMFKVGLKCENHSGSIILLKELFDYDNDKINYVKKERIDKQYYVDFDLSKKDVEEVVETAKGFNSDLFDFIERLNLDEIERARDKLGEILSKEVSRE